ncbi:MAG: ABC transporter substrate-binding protein [Dermatophilus congolensis]|nr:ABC transporter substrate-binding protein [Dermatophilus congolensis]
MIKSSTMRRSIAVSSIAALAFGLSACGSDSLGGGSAAPTDGGSAAPTEIPAVTADADLAAKVPDAIRTAGTLQVGTDGSYPPNEFIGEDGKTMEGMDVDLLDAVAAKLDLKTNYNNAAFDGIVLGVSNRKWQVGISSFTINPERKKAVNMVQYFNAGTSWATTKGNPKSVNPESPCGLAVAVQRGTVQIDDINARNKACTDAGKPAINIITEQEQTKATADVVSGKADAMLADSPVIAYALAQTGDQLEQVGQMYDAAPYGIITPLDDTQFADLISQALAKLKADGTYDAILKKWGNESGSVDSFPVNP